MSEGPKGDKAPPLSPAITRSRAAASEHEKDACLNVPMPSTSKDDETAGLRPIGRSLGECSPIRRPYRDYDAQWLPTQEHYVDRSRHLQEVTNFHDIARTLATPPPGLVSQREQELEAEVRMYRQTYGWKGFSGPPRPQRHTDAVSTEPKYGSAYGGSGRTLSDSDRLWQRRADKHLQYSGLTDWDSFEFQFTRYIAHMGLSDSHNRDLLISVLSGAALKFVINFPALNSMTTKELLDAMKRRFDDNIPVESMWLRLEAARQSTEETLEQWAERLEDLSRRMVGDRQTARSVIGSRLVMIFCLHCTNKEAGLKAIENGPPANLQDAVERIRWYQHLKEVSAPTRMSRSPVPDRGGYRYDRRFVSPRSQPEREPSHYAQGNTPNVSVREVQVDDGQYSSEHKPKWAADLTEQMASLMQVRDQIQVKAIKTEDKTPILEQRIDKLEQAMTEMAKSVNNLAKQVGEVLAREPHQLRDRGRPGLGGRPRSLSPPSRSPSRSRSPSSSPCYKCGELGHFRSECPKKNVSFDDHHLN